MKNIHVNLHFLQTEPPRDIFNSHLHYLHRRGENLDEIFGKHVDNVDNVP